MSAAAALLPRLFVDRELKFGRTWEGCLGIENATWEIVYTSPSLTGVRAAALAGLAITPLPTSAVIAGLRIVGLKEGLPRLPELEFAIYEKARPEKGRRDTRRSSIGSWAITSAPDDLRRPCVRTCSKSEWMPPTHTS